jgi:prevent-host-death family protein
MTRTIPHRELRNNSSQVLRDVAAGETVEITNHGQVVAVLVPPPRASHGSLRIRRATVRGGFSDLPRIRLDRRVAESLEDLRGDR